MERRKESREGGRKQEERKGGRVVKRKEMSEYYEKERQTAGNIRLTLSASAAAASQLYAKNTMTVLL